MSAQTPPGSRCGLDTVELGRIERLLSEVSAAELQRLFTESELADAGQGAGRVSTLAGRFAAKEAISKALGTGLHGVAWREMEVVQLRSGRPTVTLHGNAKRRAEFLGLSAFDVSIADLAEFSIAIAVAVQTSLPGQ